jgi:tetratricopeptide (TPR) repeat protein
VAGRRLRADIGDNFRVPLSLLLTALCLTAQSPPPVPPLALAAFPASARDTLTRVHLAASRRPNDPGAVGALGRWLHAWEQWEPAHQAYARAQALDSGVVDWHYLDAIVLQRLTRHGPAAARLERALALNPTYLPARVKLAEALFEAGHSQRSKPLFQELSTEPAAAPAAHFGLGRIAALEGRQDAAIAHLERAVALFPEFGAAHYALARSYRAVGRIAESVRALERHARYGPRWPRIDDPLLASVDALREDARALLRRGIRSAEAGDIEAAIASHEAALLRDPSLVQAHVNLLSLHGRAQNWVKAEAHYRAALAARYSTADLHYDHGFVLGMQQKWDAAEAAYRRAVALNPLHAHARNNLGQLLERRRAFAEAAAEYRHAVEAQPAFRLARFNLGRMLLTLAQPRDAIVEFEQLQEPRDAESPRYVFALSTALVRAGRVAEGIKLASEARRLALDFGQTELADAIARELARLR